RRRTVRRVEPLDPGLVAGGARPDRTAERRALAQRLREALAELPERRRVAVVLFDVEGYSHAEIADVLGIPEGTVRSEVFHACGRPPRAPRHASSRERPPASGGEPPAAETRKGGHAVMLNRPQSWAVALLVATFVAGIAVGAGGRALGARRAEAAGSPSHGPV